MNPIDSTPVQIKRKAQSSVAIAVIAGKLIRSKSCQACGVLGSGLSRALDGHHEDYSKPLEVVWLCRSCHGFLHSGPYENRCQFWINGKSVTLPLITAQAYQSGILIHDTEDTRDYFADTTLLHDMLSHLNSEEIKLSFYCFSRGLTFEAIGEMYGFSKQRAKQKEKELTQKLQRKFKTR